MMKKICFILLLVSLVAGVALAGIPGQISFQGRLTKDDVAVDTTTTITFTIYDAATAAGGTKQWSKRMTIIPDENGFFTAILEGADQGYPDLADLPFDIPYWMLAAVGSQDLLDNNGELQALTSAPYAFTAKSLAPGNITIDGNLGVTGNIGATGKIWAHQEGAALTSILATARATNSIAITAINSAEGSMFSGGVIGTLYNAGLASTAVGGLLYDSSNSAAVKGVIANTTDNSYAIHGKVNGGTNNFAGYFEGKMYATDNADEGTTLYVHAGDDDGTAIEARCNNAYVGRGLYAEGKVGIEGYSEFGASTGYGVRGQGYYGVYGTATKSEGYGLIGTALIGNNASGIFGYSAQRHGVVGHAGELTYTPSYDYGGLFAASYGKRALGVVGSAYASGNFNSGQGLDVAEWIKVSDASISHGDVVVIDESDNKAVKKSYEAESNLVAGVISTDPSYLAGNLTDGGELANRTKMTAKGFRMLALCGQVPCKVTDEGGPIKPGDLLTSSSTPGHAMKAVNPKIGTIVGKALEKHLGGTGKIIVLLTLQ